MNCGFSVLAVHIRTPPMCWLRSEKHGKNGKNILIMSAQVIFNNIVNVTDVTVRKPEEFLSVQNKAAVDLKNVTKSLYDFTKELVRRSNNALPELITEEFDEEQIWQQLELQNEEVEYFSRNVPNILNANETFILPNILTNSESSENEEKQENACKINEFCLDPESSQEEDSDNESSENNIIKQKRNNKKHKKSSVVDDKFFKLEELDEYLINEEKKAKLSDKKQHSSDEEESVDLFDNSFNDKDEEEQDAKFVKYADFFDSPESEEEEEHVNKRKKSSEESDEELFAGSDSDNSNDEDLNKNDEPNRKKVKFNLTADSDETDSLENKQNDFQNEDVKSSLEARQERLQKRIQNLEDEALSERPWQLRGEISGDKRPQNSLLEEFVEFDVTSRPPPVITEETTVKLEDIIKRRIKDKAWDDVERKFKPVDTPMEYKKKLILNQEKSKESLAQIYEREYIQQKQALNPDNQIQEVEEEEPKSHKEIREEMHSLFSKLDALSNFHYTPRPAQPELKIISNMPAINMEEVAPVATSDAALLAPEEIKEKPRGDVIGKSERTSTDMKRERRQKKLKQQERQKAKEEKGKLDSLKPNISKKHNKDKKAVFMKKLSNDRNVIKLDKSSNAIKSSSQFFTQLQDEVKQQIKSKVNNITKKKKNIPSAVKLKL